MSWDMHNSVKGLHDACDVKPDIYAMCTVTCNMFSYMLYCNSFFVMINKK